MSQHSQSTTGSNKARPTSLQGDVEIIGVEDSEEEEEADEGDFDDEEECDVEVIEFSTGPRLNKKATRGLLLDDGDQDTLNIRVPSLEQDPGKAALVFVVVVYHGVRAQLRHPQNRRQTRRR